MTKFLPENILINIDEHEKKYINKYKMKAIHLFMYFS